MLKIKIYEHYDHKELERLVERFINQAKIEVQDLSYSHEIGLFSVMIYYKVNSENTAS